MQLAFRALTAGTLVIFYFAAAPRAQAIVWDGGSSETDKLWNTGENWVGDTAPIGVGAEAQVDSAGVNIFMTQDVTVGSFTVTNIGSSGSLRPYDPASPTTGYDIIFQNTGAIPAEFNFDFGAGSDDGRYFLNGGNQGSVSNPARVVLGSDLNVNVTSGPGTDVQLFINGAANSLDGQGNTLALTSRAARIRVEGDTNNLTDVVLDMRAGRNGVYNGSNEDAVIEFRRGQENANVTIQAGNDDGPQSILYGASADFNSRIEIFGSERVYLSNEGGRNLSLDGVIADGDGSATTLVLRNHNPSGDTTTAIGGASANTYSGLTIVEMLGANTRLRLEKAEAIGGDLQIDDLGTLDIDAAGAIEDFASFTMLDAGLIIETGGFDLILSQWEIDGFNLSPGVYNASSGSINGFDFGTQFLGGADWTVLAIPEPTSTTLLLAAGIAACLRRRRCRTSNELWVDTPR